MTTRDKFLEFDVPNLPGQAYEVVLRVQNHVGTTHRDTIIITVEQPLDMNAPSSFQGWKLVQVILWSSTKVQN